MLQPGGREKESIEDCEIVGDSRNHVYLLLITVTGWPKQKQTKHPPTYPKKGGGGGESSLEACEVGEQCTCSALKILSQPGG